MLTHMLQFSLLTLRQHGLLPRRSTLTNLLVAEEMITKLHEGSAVDLIYLDFSKAFDSDNYRRHLAKRRGYGIGPIVIGWIECFLSRRTFQVNVNGILSQMAEAISGVPQGSVFSPILFVIYVNDLPNHLSAGSHLYADDGEHIAPRNHHDICQNSLNISSSWSKDWELNLNPAKSEHHPTGNSPILSLTPFCPIIHPTPRPYQQSPPPKTRELS